MNLAPPIKAQTLSRKVQRVPYRLQAILNTNGLRIAGPDNNLLNLESIKLGTGKDISRVGMPIDLVTFIHEYCCCTYCGRSISQELSRCVCDKPNRLHLEVTFPDEIYFSIFRPIIEREQRRLKQILRKRRTADNGGTFTLDDIDALHEQQDGLCFYCGVTIGKRKNETAFETDHYESLQNGGGNDIFNIVLACVTCNRKKGALYGDIFREKVWATLSPEVRHSLKKIQKRYKNKKRSLITIPF